jgi:4-amino-4-deoxy-L-arabinose transferase-like glycosyltransferase
MRARSWERIAFFAVLAVILAVYLYQLGRVPAGFNQDEASVGWNARTLLRHGTDQWGASWPVFFRAFDDYKSPLLIYSVMVSEALLGPTILAVRLPSVIYAFATALALYFVIVALTTTDERGEGRRPLARWLAALYLLAPSAIVFGRTGFTEAVSMPVVLLLALLAWIRLGPVRDTASAVTVGFLFGLLTYTYTTMRLLAPLFLLAVTLIAATHRPLRRHASVVFAIGVLVMMPYLYYLAFRPGQLDYRFQQLSIFFDHPTALTALGRFLDHYALHLGFRFLFWSGDANPVLGAGNGLLPLWLALPFVGGLAVCWRRRREPIVALLLVMLVLTPVPASLTQFEIPHASRMLHLLPLAFIVTALGLDAWLTAARPPATLLAVLAALPLLESALFVRHYFVEYPAISRVAFDDGRAEALRLAYAARRPGARVAMPKYFLQFGGMWVAFAGDYDAAIARERGFPDIMLVDDPAAALPPGTVFITDGRVRPTHPADLIGTVGNLFDASARWSIWRMR